MCVHIILKWSPFLTLILSQEAELVRLAKAREQELQYKKEIDHLEVEKQQKLSEIESQRFKELVDAIGSGTLTEMARAGPELQVHFIICISFMILYRNWGFDAPTTLLISSVRKVWIKHL